MRNEPPPVVVEFTPHIVKDLKRLSKKFPRAIDDLERLIARLENGETPGTRVQGVEHVVFKTRLRSGDLTRGKSAGYRVLYYVKTAERIILLTMYIKSQTSDIRLETIRQIINDYQPD